MLSAKVKLLTLFVILAAQHFENVQPLIIALGHLPYNAGHDCVLIENWKVQSLIFNEPWSRSSWLNLITPGGFFAFGTKQLTNLDPSMVSSMFARQFTAFPSPSLDTQLIKVHWEMVNFPLNVCDKKRMPGLSVLAVVNSKRLL